MKHLTSVRIEGFNLLISKLSDNLRLMSIFKYLFEIFYIQISRDYMSYITTCWVHRTHGELHIIYLVAAANNQINLESKQHLIEFQSMIKENKICRNGIHAKNCFHTIFTYLLSMSIFFWPYVWANSLITNLMMVCIVEKKSRASGNRINKTRISLWQRHYRIYSRFILQGLI